MKCEGFFEDWAKHYRQTIILTSHLTPDINNLFHNMCSNHLGKLQIRPQYTGVLNKVIPVVRQVRIIFCVCVFFVVYR